MTATRTSLMLKIVNFAVGAALLAMLYPVDGKPVVKPAGVRSAVETIGKKPVARPVRPGRIVVV